MRLDKFVSHTSHLSRTESRRAIKSSAVQINGEVVSNPKRDVSDADSVTLEGESLSLPGALYLMLHKPAGYICASTDGEHPTVIDLLADLSIAETSTLAIAGRLDKDTTGLLLLSNDGQWIHRVSSPRHEHPKTYIAELEREVSEADVVAFSEGILLRSETSPTRPAPLKALPQNRAEVILNEGRYHQVKRMFAATSNRVTALHRQRVGDIELDPGLAPGEYRRLTPAEVESV